MITDAEMYAEVFDLLKYMEKSTVMKIPVEILEYIKKSKSDTYVTRVDKNDIDNPDNIDQRSIDLFTWLTVNYFSTEQEKDEILKVTRENDYKNRTTEEDYNKIFENNKRKQEGQKENIVPTIIEDRKESLIQKIITFIKKIFS